MDERPRRLLLPALTVVALLVAGVIAVVTLTDGDGTDAGRTGTTSDLDLLFSTSEPAAASNADRPRRRDGRGHWRLQDGEKVLTGEVVSVADGSLVVRKDGGADVTVPTDGDTKIRGRDTQDGLDEGRRVIVKAGADGVADVVLAVRAHAGGTVTELNGDRATVVRPGGQTVTLDLSGVPERPAVGTVILAVGTTTDDGTIKVEQLRELPTLG